MRLVTIALALLVASGCTRKPTHESDSQKVRYPNEQGELTEIDLSDNWSPYLFSRATDEGAFKKKFVALANEQSILSPIEKAVSKPGKAPESFHRYLSVYGIFPTLSVLKLRSETEINRPCFSKIDTDAIGAYRGFLSYKNNPTAREQAKQGRMALEALQPDMVRRSYATLTEYRANTTDSKIRQAIDNAIEYQAVNAAQQHLICEGLLKKSTSIIEGGLGYETHLALRHFERKNHIYGWGYLSRDTVNALKQSLQERIYHALVRVITERVVHGAGIIEMKNEVPTSADTYKDEDGIRRTVPDLSAQFTKQVLTYLGITSVESGIRFLRNLSYEQLTDYRIKLHLPKKPPYYQSPMKLSIDIDRGDVYHDFPFHPYQKGKKRHQKRKRLPTLQLFVTWRGQKIRLAVMSTSIGGWQNEQAEDGYVYLKYKPSPPGKGIIKEIIAAPTWMPPPSTPLDELLKTVRHQKRDRIIPDLNAVGPWYASAYGLVAAVHLQRNKRNRFLDLGIRSHGTHDYTSITKRYSHGCHRLFNHLALRLYSFVLRHTPHQYLGRHGSRKTRQFKYKQRFYKIEVQNDGEMFQLDTPIPVNTLPGTIKGFAKHPIMHYLPRPDIPYGPDALFGSER